MKTIFSLISTLFLAGAASAQFTPSNTPEIGNSIQLYVVDSAATDLKTTTGAGVVWDYSGLIDYNEETRLIQVKTPHETGHGVTFVNSDRAIETQGELIAFFKDDGIQRTSQGVVYHDANNGDLILTLETDQGLYYTYPFDLGSTIVDDIEGTATFTFMGQVVNAPAIGKAYTSVDGKGTLKMGLTGVYNDVLRFNITDTIRLTTGVGEFSVIHNQYEYYDHSVSNLPLFVHSYLWFGLTGGAALREFTFVLSKDILSSSTTKETLTETKIYPNPAHKLINIQLPNGIYTAEISIVDAVGRVVLNANIEDSFANLSISHLNEGAYFVRITADHAVVTKTLILQ